MSAENGALPPGWTWAALRDLGVWSGGGTPSKKNMAYWEGGTVPWVSPKDMGPLQLTGTQDHITQVATEESAARTVPADSIAFVVRSGILSRILPISLVPFDAAYNQDMRVLTPAPSLDTEWLLWALRAAAEDIRRRCQKHGTTVASIEVPQLQAYELPVPPVRQQRAIAETLGRLFTTIDNGLSSLRAAQKQLRPFHESILVSGLTGGMSTPAVPRASAVELRQRVLDKRCERWLGTGMGRYTDPVPPTPPSDIELPDGWCWATVDELAVGVQYGTSAKTSSDATGVPVLRMGNLVDGGVDVRELKFLPTEHDEFPALFLAEGDLLFNRTNSPELVGKTAVVRDVPEPCSFASYLIRVRFAPEVCPELVSWFINSPFGRRWVRENASQQVGQANVNGSKLRALTVPLPPLESQACVASQVRKLLVAKDAMSDSLTTTAADAERLKDSLLAATRRGELEDALPTDEPAERLLERVRHEVSMMDGQRKAWRRSRRTVPVGR